MWNPFTTPMQSTAYANPEPINSTDSSVSANVPVLSDAYIPDDLPYDYYGNMGETVGGNVKPGYAGSGSRTLVLEPGQATDTGYSFLFPAPGSVDLTAARDSGGIPGTTELNIRNGPVSGNQMDVYGNVRQGLDSQPPGYYGPVQGGTPQDQLISQAFWQQSFAIYSNASSDQAMVAAV